MLKLYTLTPDEIRLLDELNIVNEYDLIRYYESTYDERVAHLYRFIMTGISEPSFRYMMRLGRVRN